MRKGMLLTILTWALSSQAMAQATELKCFISTKSGEEIELTKNEMKTPKGYAHLKGQSFQKVVTLQDGSKMDVIFTLRGKNSKNFDLRINSTDFSVASHVNAALDNRDSFQYTDYGKVLALKCTKDY